MDATRRILIIQYIDTDEICVYISVDGEMSNRYKILRAYPLCHGNEYRHPSFDRTYSAACRLANEMRNARLQYCLDKDNDICNIPEHNFYESNESLEAQNHDY